MMYEMMGSDLPRLHTCMKTLVTMGNSEEYKHGVAFLAQRWKKHIKPLLQLCPGHYSQCAHQVGAGLERIVPAGLT